MSRARRVTTHGTLAFANTMIFRLAIASPFLLWADLVSSRGWGLSPLLGLTGAAEIVATIVVFDFLDYWKHRWFHRSPLGWRFHLLHHTDTHLDLTTGLRYHAGELFLSAVIKAGWILAWGPSAAAFAAFEIVLNMASQFHHSNIDLGDRLDRIVGRLVVTPRYHAIHHSVGRIPFDTNYSTIFNLWDRLGKSREEPALEKIDFGRMGETDSSCMSWRHLWLRPFRRSASREVLKGIPEQAHWLANRKEAKLLDVRERDELEEGLASLAEWIPTSGIESGAPEWIAFLDQTDPRQHYFVYCVAGVRAAKVAKCLADRGLQAYNLGGFKDWQGAGLPVRLHLESSPAAEPSRSRTRA
jgi:sterol desaturase/sphingolipid hydroxylase (fatty acid hydroxylase superfamily)/rhodanese-related sulfurtransferase